MNRTKLLSAAIAAALPLGTATGALAQASATGSAQDMAELTVISRLMNGYTVNGNVPYKSVNGWTGRLDVYIPRNLTAPNPTLIYFHGGGWVTGTKEERSLLLLPYLLKGWTVVNVEYRVRDQARAPAAAEDAWCALQWVHDHANASFRGSTGAMPYFFDTERIVTTGTSAGGHLALLVGMAQRSAGLGKDCVSERREELKVAAIVDWFGIADVAEFLGSPGASTLANEWIGDRADAAEIARLVSPINYVRNDVPPIISLHGDMDPVVPYEGKRLFHQALDRAGADHELIPIAGGGHGIFKPEQNLEGYGAIWEFLEARGLEPEPRLRSK